MRLLPVLALAAFAAGVCRAETIHVNPGFGYDLLGSESGMPQTSALVALQTHDGYLWVGTQGGLGRYDGVRFTSYSLAETSHSDAAAVRSLFEDSQGTLWIGTETGLLCRRGGVFTRVEPSGAVVSTIAESADHTLWVGTTSKGLFRLKDGVATAVDDGGVFPSHNIECVFCDSANRVWIGFYDAGLVVYENGKFRRDTQTGAAEVEVRSFCEQPKGTLWIGTRTHGLYRVRGAESLHLQAANGILGNHAMRLCPDISGGLWVMSDGLQRIANPAEPRVDTVLTIKNGALVSIYSDAEGTAWLSARDDGLIHVRKLRYSAVTSQEGLSSDVVRSVAVDSSGTAWIAPQGGGLAAVSPDGSLVEWAHLHGLPDENPGAIWPASDGSLWLGYNSLTRYKDGAFETYGDVHRVRTIFEDHAHSIWVGTQTRGVLRFRNGSFEEIDSPKARFFALASYFAEAQDGTLYIGSNDNGLVAWKDGHANAFTTANGLPSDRVRAIYAGDQGRLWVGARGVGLEVMDQGQWRHTISLANQLAGQVSGIVEDNHDDLWLATPAGILWGKKDRILAAASQEGVDAGLRTLANGDAVHGAPAISGGSPSVWRDTHGKLAFATRRGALFVDPDHLPVNSRPPPVSIEAIRLDEQEVSAGEAVAVPPSTRVVAIEYTAPSFVQPGRVLFRHRLEGFESRWVEAGTRRMATYEALPPGSYRFHVSACNDDGVWNPVGATLGFTVEPYFWQRTSFRLAVIAIFTLAIVVLVRWLSFRRLQSKLRTLGHQIALDKERSRIARDIHDDVGNRLTEITLLTELALRDEASGASNLHVRQIAESARAVTDSLDEIVWAVSPRNDTFAHLINYLAQFAADFFRKAGVACRLELPERAPEAPVPSDVRHNIYLAVKEAATNVVRHAKASQVTLRITSDEQAMVIELRDNGVGFTINATQDGGNGLGNFRQRMELIGGTVSVQSVPGGGSCITFNIPWTPKL